MNAPYAKPSIRSGLKVKIAPVHPDSWCDFWSRPLMGFADWHLNRYLALWVLQSYRALPTTVLPVLPSLHDCLSNRWFSSPFFVVAVLLLLPT